MPEMSADVEHPNVSLTAVGPPAAPATSASRPADSVVPLTPAASCNGNGAHGRASPDPTLPLVTTPASPDAPRWRLVVAGYAMLLAGFALALILPHFHLRAGFREAALVVVSIVTMLAGAVTVVASFLLNLLRQP